MEESLVYDGYVLPVLCIWHLLYFELLHLGQKVIGRCASLNNGRAFSNGFRHLIAACFSWLLLWLSQTTILAASAHKSNTSSST
jgi:hypothetical protein